MKHLYTISDEELLYLYRLKSLIRYNGRTKISQENVAEHSFYVTLFVLKICDDLHTSEYIRSSSIIKALLHDMPEIEFNDITYDVKEKLNLRPLLKTYENEYYKTHFPIYENLMKDDDENTWIYDVISTTIVDLADCLSVKQYCLHEQSIGNSTLELLLKYTENRILTINDKLGGLLNEIK